MDENPGLVVIGHGPAGAAAAVAFREQDPDAAVTVITGESLSCYSRPRLPEVVSGHVSPEAIRLHPDDWYAARKIKLLLCEEAVLLDLDHQKVSLRSGAELSYSRLILAMGAVPVLPPIAGLPLENVYVLRTAENALRIKKWAEGKKSAVLVGGGLLGLEAAYALTRLGLRVSVIEAAPWLLPRQMDPEGSALLQAKLIPMGFEFYLGASVASVESTEGQVALSLNNQTRLEADLAILSAGVRPCAELAQGTALTLNKGIWVDDRMQTSREGVFAAGDVAEWRGQIAGLWSAAQAMGRVAGINAAGGNAAYPGQVPSTTLKIAGVEVCSQGDVRSSAERVWVRNEDGYWVKLFCQGSRVIGSIQIGRTAGSAALRKIMDRSLSIEGFESEILSDGFDFNRIPGFAN